jgi:hypothetical protein
LTSAVKVKAESTLDMVVIGCTSTAAALSTLVLAFPGVVDAERRAGDGRVNHRADQGGGQIGRAAAAAPRRELRADLCPSTHEPSTVIVVEPLVVEGEADASVETGVLRRAARLHRARPDLDVDELE